MDYYAWRMMTESECKLLIAGFCEI